MNDITEMLKTLNIDQDELKKLADSAKNNPMEAMANIQKLIPADMLQQMLAAMMQNPQAMSEAMENAGISEEQVADAKRAMNLD